MEVSVIITTFNNPQRLEKSLKTVENQKFKAFEIIVVDGANSKECRTVAEKHKAVFVGLEKDLPPPNGVQRSRNEGIKHAKGIYVAFLDDDDEWLPRKLELQYEDLLSGSDLVSCDTIVKYENKVFEDKKIREPTFPDLLRSFAISSTSSIIAKKEVLLEVGGWNENVRGMHEYDLALRVSRAGYKITNVQIPLMIKNQDLSVQLGTVYWKIAEMFEFFHLYKKDVFQRLGFKGYVFNVIKMWISIAIYSFTFIVGDRIWRILYFLRTKGGLNDKNKRKHKGEAQIIGN